MNTSDEILIVEDNPTQAAALAQLLVRGRYVRRQAL